MMNEAIIVAVLGCIGTVVGSGDRCIRKDEFPAGAAGKKDG